MRLSTGFVQHVETIATKGIVNVTDSPFPGHRAPRENARKSGVSILLYSLFLVGFAQVDNAVVTYPGPSVCHPGHARFPERWLATFHVDQMRLKRRDGHEKIEMGFVQTLQMVAN
jgi:hypothetical protein